jgi:predicted nucleic acid-binding protein
MIVVDSSGWIEHLTDGPLARAYQEYLEAPDLLVPAVVIYEVYKFMKREVSEQEAVSVAGRHRAAQVVSLNEELALEAADLSLQYGLAMADAVVYATARHYEALLVTSDADFADLPGVKYLESPDS